MYSKYGSNQLVIDNVDLTSYLIVEDIDRQFMPYVSNTFINIPSRDGELHGSTTYGKKTITVTVRIVDYDVDDVNTIKNTIISALSTKAQKKLQLPDVPGKYEMVVLDGAINFDRLFSGARIAIRLINPAGVFFNNAETIKALSGTSTAIEYSGTAETFMELTVVSNGTNPATITNTDTGDIITLEGLASGDVVTINFEEEAVRIRSTLRMDVLWLNSDFWTLIPGTTNLSVTNLTLQEVKYRKRWY